MVQKAEPLRDGAPQPSAPEPDRGQAGTSGPTQTLEALARASYSDVWRMCAALVDRQAADDLAQETFARAARSLGAFRGQANPRLWIFAIARNTCMDELRRRHRGRRRQERLEAIAAAARHTPDPSGEVTANELLMHLDDDRRAAFVLTQLFRFSYQEAAVVCNCPAGTIRSRVSRAREDLIAMLTGPAGHPGAD